MLLSQSSLRVCVAPTPLLQATLLPHFPVLLLSCSPTVLYCCPLYCTACLPPEIAGDASVEEAAAAYDRAQAVARSDNRIEVEVDFKWVGEPNISFFVELALAG